MSRHWQAIGHNGGPTMVPEKAKIEAIDAVLQDQRYDRTEALILIGLIVRSDDEFANAFPGGKTLAMYARRGTNTDYVFRALKRLEEEHKVIERQSRGKGRSNAYCVLPMHIIEAITAEYAKLKAEKKAKPTPVVGVPSVQTHPQNRGDQFSQPTPKTGAPPNQTHPCSRGTIVIDSLESKSPTKDSLESITALPEILDQTTGSFLAAIPPPVVAAPKTKRAPRSAPRARIAETWTPTAEMVVWVQGSYAAEASQIEREAQKFRDYHLSRGSLMADWAAAWRTWWGNGYHGIPKRTKTAVAPLLGLLEPSLLAEQDMAREFAEARAMNERLFK